MDRVTGTDDIQRTGTENLAAASLAVELDASRPHGSKASAQVAGPSRPFARSCSMIAAADSSALARVVST